jgi:F-type H+-transporting ATPase subunit b
MISINATLVVQVIHFLLMVFILNRLMLRPIMRQISEREEHIKKTKQDSEEMAAEAERLVEKRLSMVNEARRKAALERSKSRENAWSAAEGIFDETRREVGRIRERVQAQVQEQLEKAQETLDLEARSLADEIAERIAGRRISN